MRKFLFLFCFINISLFGQDSFPDHPIDIITHASPGGGTDTTARTMALAIQSINDVDIGVFPRTGGGGVVAMNYFDRQIHDGHNILAITPTHLFAMARGQSTVNIDDLIGIARATDDPLVVMVHQSSPFLDLNFLINYGKSTPIKWGTTQVGGVDHVAGAILALRANTQLDVVPFSGGGQIVTNLTGQTIDAAALNLTEAFDQIERGIFRPLAVLSPNRISLLPNVPTARELGYDVVFSTVRGYLVHKDTPLEHIETLQTIFSSGLNNQIFKDYLIGSGLTQESIAIGEEWDLQVRELYEDARIAMLELGIIQNPEILEQYMSPYFFPRLLIISILILSLWAMYKNRHSKPFFDLGFNRTISITTLILIASGFLFSVLGVILGLSVLLILLQFAWGQENKKILFLVSAITPIMIYLIFSILLNVRFPGILWA